MQQKKLIIILADISGYTQFMLDNRTAAVHGQMVINALIESILAQVDIPLTLSPRPRCRRRRSVPAP